MVRGMRDGGIFVESSTTEACDQRRSPACFGHPISSLWLQGSAYQHDAGRFVVIQPLPTVDDASCGFLQPSADNALLLITPLRPPQFVLCAFTHPWAGTDTSGWCNQSPHAPGTSGALEKLESWSSLVIGWWLVQGTVPRSSARKARKNPYSQPTKRTRGTAGHPVQNLV